MVRYRLAVFHSVYAKYEVNSMSIRIIFSKDKLVSASITDRTVKITYDNNVLTGRLKHNCTGNCLQIVIDGIELDLIDFETKSKQEIDSNYLDLAEKLIQEYTDNPTEESREFLKEYLFSLKKVVSMYRKAYHMNEVIERIEQVVKLEKNYKPKY